MIESVEVVIKQPGQAERIERLQDGATRLGRAEDNEVVLSDAGVSRRHAQVYVSRGEVTVEDLGSGNGTYYNGYRVNSQPVQDGDEIVIDPFVLQFRIRGQERAIRPDQGARDSSTPARLEVVVGTGMAGSSYPITSRGLSIGRSEDREVVIPDPAASRHHCQISPQGNEYMLRDMGSANGVFVNAVRVRECTLADGDLVRIGNTEMRFVRFDQAGRGPASQVPSSNQGGWNEPSAPVGAGPSYGAPPAAAAGPAPTSSGGGGGRLIAVAFAGIVAFLSIIGVVVIVLVITYFVVFPPWPQGPAPIVSQPPRWKLDLPPNLPSAQVDDLFFQGRDKMVDKDHKAALQDFYRILNADPGRHGVGKFAFAAGEIMVMEALAKDFERRSKVRAERERERDTLLARATRGSRKEKSRVLLRQRFLSDPVVMERMGWEAPEEIVALRTRQAEADRLLAAGQAAEASRLYLQVLQVSVEPVAREQAVANFNAAQRILAESAAPLWTEAVMLEAVGERGPAKTKFKDLTASHPDLPSATAHLERY